MDVFSSLPPSHLLPLQWRLNLHQQRGCPPVPVGHRTIREILRTIRELNQKRKAWRWKCLRIYVRLKFCRNSMELLILAKKLNEFEGPPDLKKKLSIHCRSYPYQQTYQQAFARPTGVDPIVCSGECKTCNDEKIRMTICPFFWLENSPKTEANLPEIMNDLVFLVVLIWFLVYGVLKITTWIKLFFLWHLVKGSTQHLCHFHIGCPLLYGAKMLHMAIKSPWAVQWSTRYPSLHWGAHLRLGSNYRILWCQATAIQKVILGS